MSDRELRELCRGWRAQPSDDLLTQAVIAHRRAKTDLPWDLLAESQRWRRVTGFVRKWFKRPLAESDGCTARELDAAQARTGNAWPLALREWYRLLGRREAVTATVSMWGTRLIDPAKLEVNGRAMLVPLAYYDEDVMNCWEVDPQSEVDDPSVQLEFQERRGEEMIISPVTQAADSLSDFLLAFVIHQYLSNLEGPDPESDEHYIFRDDYQPLLDEKSFVRAGTVASEDIEPLLRSYTELPVQFKTGESEYVFYGDGDTVILTTAVRRGRTATAATRTQEAADRVALHAEWVVY